MARIGIAGRIRAFGKDGVMGFVNAIPTIESIVDVIENAINGQIDSTNLADGAVTATKVASGSLTPTQMADTVGQTYSATYTGDGTTANRVIAIPFTPRWVQIFPTTGTFVEHVAHAIGAATYYFERDATGAIVTDAANFQGIVANGVKLGTSATGTTNTATVVYSLVAYK